MKERSKCWRTICISLEIGQAVLELLSFKFGSGNHQRGMSLLQKFLDIFAVRSTGNDVTSDKSQCPDTKLKIEIFPELCKI